jgi:hypothetical protein
MNEARNKADASPGGDDTTRRFCGERRATASDPGRPTCSDGKQGSDPAALERRVLGRRVVRVVRCPMVRMVRMVCFSPATRTNTQLRAADTSPIPWDTISSPPQITSAHTSSAQSNHANHPNPGNGIEVAFLTTRQSHRTPACAPRSPSPALVTLSKPLRRNDSQPRAARQGPANRPPIGPWSMIGITSGPSPIPFHRGHCSRSMYAQR